jgi:hypothetical protein
VRPRQRGWPALVGYHSVSGPAAFTVRSSIVAGNTPDDCGAEPVTSAGFNLQSGASCAFVQATDRSSPDPGLAPLGDHGGPTLVHLPLAGSPALDAGGEVGCPPLDPRDVSRPQPSGPGGLARCDIGAVEWLPAEGAGRVPALVRPVDLR